MRTNSCLSRIYQSKLSTLVSTLPLALFSLISIDTMAQSQIAKPAIMATKTTPALVPTAKPALSYSALLATSKPSDWRALDLENTLVMELDTSPVRRLIIELAPSFAPLHAVNIKKLVRDKYFDGLHILRSQDNYVVQWGEADADANSNTTSDATNPKPVAPLPSKRALNSAAATLPPEFTRPFGTQANYPAYPFTKLPDVDGYAKEVGFSAGFPMGRDSARKQAWLTHCYGMVGVGRDTALDSGNGSEMYVVTGHAPRHLDRNIAVVGRVISGMPDVSSLPRGTREMGFYATAEHRIPIATIRIAADLAKEAQPRLEIINTESTLFLSLVEALRNRGKGVPDSWFKEPAGHVELCNVALAVREKK
jgi:cyclophilin family peptidyl-prolyl cis-trans isomerase